MIRKIIFLILFFYFLTLLQTSFFIHFNLSGMIFSFVLIFITIINILERTGEKMGIIAAFLGGFYLDVFSISNDLFFGFYVLISVAISLFIKLILRKHVEIPIEKKF